MSSLWKLLEKYLSHRENLGFTTVTPRTTLRELVGFVEAEDAEHLTTDDIVRWVRLPEGCHPNWWATRFSLARDFAKYCSTVDLRTEIPPEGMFQFRKHRPRPYIYSNAELKRILEAATNVSGQMRSWTYRTLFGLQAATGMRAREPLKLDRDDVDLVQGVLKVRNTKFGKYRFLPVRSSTLRALREYARQRDVVHHVPPGAAFFVFSNGNRVGYASAYNTFRRLLDKAGIRKLSDRRGPRLHDLRHAFAVNTLIRWYRTGLDVEKQLPILATYLGHSSVIGTYWYLSATPELLGLAQARLEKTLGDLP